MVSLTRFDTELAGPRDLATLLALVEAGDFRISTRDIVPAMATLRTLDALLPDRDLIEQAKRDWDAQRFPLIPDDHDVWVPAPPL